uniref:DUF6562 domain-containing protein n=1 Tax=Candidatus Limisoma sp. TaxID=3076476 RepID=UPI004026AFA9
MKRYLLSTFTIAAAALLVTSCNDEMDNGLKTGDEGTVTFTAQLPSEMGTRAFADGLTAKHLQYAVYEAGQSTPLPVFGDETTVVGEAEMNNLKQTVSLKLTTGKTYDVIFWADATTDSPYTFNPASQEVSVDYSKVNNNSDNCDAFFKKETITVSGNQSVDVKLTRPFAQVNIGTDDFDAAKASGLEVTQTEVVAKAFATLNLATGKVSDEADRTFTMKAIPTASDGEFPVAGGYKYLSMDYLLVGADKATVDVAFNYGGPQNRTFTNVPVQRNYRTNIYGSLLTNTTDFNVVIEPAFATTNYNLGALYTASQIGGAVTLSDNVDFDRTIAVQPGKTMSVNLNGKTVKNTTDLWENPSVPNSWSLFSVRGTDSKLTLSGDGDVIAKANDCYAIDVQGGGHLVIEGGHYNGNIHAVYVTEGVAEIKGGTFEVQQKYPDAEKADEFVLNCLDENYKNGTAKIIVTGGTFIGFNPGDCKAEGNGTNFVAPGYASIANGTAADGRTIWKVVPAVEATTEAELEGSFKRGSVTAISSNISTATITTCHSKSNLVFKNGSVLKLEPTETGDLYTLSVRKNSNLTISGNGSIIAPVLISPNPTTSQAAAIEVGVQAYSGIVNIYDNVTLEGNSGAAGSYALKLVNGTANIYGGHFKTAGGLNGDSECIYLQSIKPWRGTYRQCNLNIYGGVFETTGDAKYLINCKDEPYKDGKCAIKIMGGIFVGFNPADNTAEGAHTNFVAPGYKSVETTYNGKQAWKVVKE